MSIAFFDCAVFLGGLVDFFVVVSITVVFTAVVFTVVGFAGVTFFLITSVDVFAHFNPQALHSLETG